MTEKTIQDRLAHIERAVFAADDDWPPGHASLQAQLDELYALYGDLKSVMADAPPVLVTRVSVIVHGEHGHGLEYESRGLSDVELSYQDDGRTLKIFSKRDVPRDTDDVISVKRNDIRIALWASWGSENKYLVGEDRPPFWEDGWFERLEASIAAPREPSEEKE